MNVSTDDLFLLIGKQTVRIALLEVQLARLHPTEPERRPLSESERERMRGAFDEA